jgi:hypothetical protein
MLRVEYKESVCVRVRVRVSVTCLLCQRVTRDGARPFP